MERFKISGVFVSILYLFLQVNAPAQSYVLIGWNDLGMHCANKDFSKLAVLPPYNNVSAQLIKKIPGAAPQVITAGVLVEYSIPGNTYSVGKTNFWTFAQQLFNLPQPLPDNIGLTGKGLTGTLDPTGNYFVAHGIPVTPFQDNNLTNESPYQLIHLVAKNQSTMEILAQTDVVIPVSNEIGCVQANCHSSEQSILNQHENAVLTTPVLCANCHADNALGTPGVPGVPSFSLAMHGHHAELGLPATTATCYKCHPGPNTQCFRDVMSQITNPTINCENCHGTMQAIALSIENGRRPWLDEPKCGDVLCHGSQYSEQTGKLFRQSQGHGNLFCSACHSSPHAILPSRETNDNLQNITLQGFAGTLQVCSVCHGDNPATGGPHQSFVQYFPLTVTVTDGWNMVSVPGLLPSNQNVTTWWPYRDMGASVFKYSGSYQQVTNAAPTEGYWMKHTGSRIYNTGDEWPSAGIQMVAHNPIPAGGGWNLIGGLEDVVPVSSITTTPPNLISGAIYKYQSGYISAASIEPGFAYWVNLTAAGQINIPQMLPGPIKSAMQTSTEGFGRIIITDNSGSSYTLYAASGANDMNQFELPPVPPPGIFDIRYSSQRYVEDLSSPRGIEMQGLQYPVRVRAEGKALIVSDESGKEIERLRSGEETLINTPGKLYVSENIIPAAYSLDQNYPNPFNPGTTIQFALPEDAGNVKLTIYNELGEKVADLVNTALKAGIYKYTWNADNVSSGLYIYQIVTGKFISTKKMILIR